MAVDTAAAFYQYPFAHIATFMHQCVGGKDGAVPYLAVSGNLYSIAYHAVVANLGVMANMSLSHYKTVASYACG